MKADATGILMFLQNAHQLVIPIYQRPYSWDGAQCDTLWDDIIRTGRTADVSSHFIGSIVCVEERLGTVTSWSPLLVIDGQQRLTTISLILAAFAKWIEVTSEGFHAVDDDELSATKLRNRYLLDAEESGDRRYKLVLTQADKRALMSLVEARPMPDEASDRIRQNFDLFENRMKSPGFDPHSLWKGLVRLRMVEIRLDRNGDDPQAIFESMNSTGRALTQSDLIRNYVLMNLERDHQTRLYDNHWRPIEAIFGKTAHSRYFDGFMRNYLTLKRGEIPKLAKIYETFRRYAQEPDIADQGIDQIVEDVRRYAGYYSNVVLRNEGDPRLGSAFADLLDLTDVANPFLLGLYHDYDQSALSGDDFERIVRMIESYVFRRAVCAIPTNSLNKTFATFSRAVDKDCYVDSVQQHFANMPSYRRFPRDIEFRRELEKRNMYNIKSGKYWFRKMENHDRKEHVSVEEYTIEHIMPRKLSDEWKRMLGADWSEVHERFLHTIGNLTLTGYNSEYGNRSFREKRDMPGGFRESPLKMNEDLKTVDVWNQEAIQKRAKRLSRIAVSVWPGLGNRWVGEEHLESELEAAGALGHENLAEGTHGRRLFDQLRPLIMALDPCVTERVRQTYVGYEAETIFASVVPQASQLKIVLDLPFHELRDDRGLGRDVSDVGHWGKGDVEVTLAHTNDLQYVMGLIRQSFQRQVDVEGTG